MEHTGVWELNTSYEIVQVAQRILNADLRLCSWPWRRSINTVPGTSVSGTSTSSTADGGQRLRLGRVFVTSRRESKGTSAATQQQRVKSLSDLHWMYSFKRGEMAVMRSYRRSRKGLQRKNRRRSQSFSPN
jgi:hypothetical protein